MACRFVKIIVKVNSDVLACDLLSLIYSGSKNKALTNYSSHTVWYDNV